MPQSESPTPPPQSVAAAPCQATAFAGQSSQAGSPRASGWWIAFGSLALILAVVAVLASVGYLKYLQIAQAMAAQPPPEMPTVVRMAAGEPTTFRHSSVVVGNVLAPQSIRLRTELTGVVTEVLMRPGQRVAAGDVLVQFDVRSEIAERKSAEANRQLAISALKRAEQLTNAKAASQQEYDIAAAELARAEAEVERLEVMIDKKTLRAPFDAQAGLFDLHVGQYLDAGVEITTLEGIEDYVNIDFSVPAHVADWVQVGDQVRIQAGDQVESTAEVVAIDSHADAISRGLLTRARLRNPPQSLQPNDSVRVAVEFGPAIDAIAIASTAIRRGPTGTSVFVAEASPADTNGDGATNGNQATNSDDATSANASPPWRAAVREVTLGGSTGSRTWVTAGLTADDVVVTDGSFKVAPGMLLANSHAAVHPTTDAQAGESNAGMVEADGSQALDVDAAEALDAGAAR